jgi:FdhE protein
MTASLNAAVLDLGRQYPDWQPWLTVIEEVLREATDAKWEALVAEPPQSQESKVPLLAGATLSMDTTAVSRWSERLMRAAYRSGAPKMSTLDGVQHKRLNTVDLFKSSLCQNGKWLREAAVELDVDADALQAVALLIPVPFLQACNRRWASSIAESWTEGYCPVCGAWPAFAEVRGIERSRYLRCGRCGGGWQAQCLSCSYCAMTEHEELVTLVPEKSGSNAAIDACKRCHGYVKTFTTLQGSPPANVMLDDLASVDLDIAALEQGYRRPEGAGYSLDIKIVPKPGFSERILSWRT